MNLADSAKGWFSNKDIFNGIIAGLVVAALLALPLYAARATRLIVRWTKIGVLWRLLTVNIGWLIVAWIIPMTFHTVAIFAIIGIVAAFSTLIQYRPFYQLGLIDAHIKTKDGINFDTSLKIARSSMDFLGIGADKLTSSAEFEPAMMRCATAGNRVRFLLSPIDNPALERAAVRNGVDASAYKDRVRESYRRIAKLRQLRNLNIEVRTYPAASDKDLQQFRLMFIDGSICLAGWTVWGAHVGRDNPQLVFRHHARSHPDVTAYKAFHDYFESLWDDPATQKLELTEIK